MKRLVKNGGVIYDKKHSQEQLVGAALEKLEILEDILEYYNIKSLEELRVILALMFIGEKK